MHGEVDMALSPCMRELEVHSLVRTHAVGRWNRLLVAYHVEPPTAELVAREVDFYRTCVKAATAPLAALLVIERAFPPPGLHVQGVYRRLLAEVSPEEIVIVLGDSGFGASLVRSIATKVMSLASRIPLQLPSSTGEAAVSLAATYGDGASADDLVQALRDLRSQIDAA